MAVKSTDGQPVCTMSRCTALLVMNGHAAGRLKSLKHSLVSCCHPVTAGDEWTAGRLKSLNHTWVSCCHLVTAGGGELAAASSVHWTGTWHAANPQVTADTDQSPAQQ